MHAVSLTNSAIGETSNAVAYAITPADCQKHVDHNSGLLVRHIQRHEVSADFVTRWRDLQTRSCHSNAFLSPDFLIPAWKCFDPMGHSFLQTVEERSSGRLLAIGCFEHSLATRSFPLPHLVAAKTIHSYRTGLLLDDQRADEVLDHWLNDLHSQPNCHGVEFPSIRLASDLAKRLQAAVDRHQLTWQVPEQWNSAALFSPAVEFENLYGHLSNDRQKALRKKATHLGKSGLVRLRQIDCGSPLGNSVEKFLELEHASWKGQFGTSLLSTDSGIRFVHCMANSFQQQTQLVLTQLQVGSETAATAISLIDGTTMFTFKLGWHPKFSKASPGVLHMHLLLPFVHEHFPNITCLDSCARPNSFFESLWPHQIPVGNAIIATSSLAQGIVASMSVAKKVFGHFSQSLSS